MKIKYFISQKGVLCISGRPRLRWLSEFMGHEYKFFNYTPFYNDDILLSMYSRLSVIVETYRPSLVIIDFKHPDCINQYEKKMLGKYGRVIEYSKTSFIKLLFL